MSKTRKKDLVKRRKRLNQLQDKKDDRGLRVDSSHISSDASRYEIAQMQLLRGDLSLRRVESLLDEAIDRDDYGTVRLAAQGLIDLREADGEIYAISGLAAMRCGLIHIALTDLHRACRTGEAGPMVAQAIEALPTVVEAVGRIEYPETLRRSFSPRQLAETSYQNDRVQELIQHDQFELAQNFAERALRQFPGCLPLQNNIIHLSIVLGDFEQARSHATDAIGDHPDDVFAIANSAMLDWIHGDLSTCRARLERVDQIPENRREGMSHVMEAAHKANQPQRLLEIWEANEGLQDESFAEHFAHDAKLAAWAYGRVGKVSAALAVLDRVELACRDDRHWDMVDDLELPEQFQVGVSPLPDASWLPRSFLSTLKSHVDDVSQIRRLLLNFVEKYPSILEGVLERGPMSSRRLMLQACFDAKTLSPQVLDALESFASGRWGPIADRLVARKVGHGHGRCIERCWGSGGWIPDEFVKLDLHAESAPPAARTDEVNELMSTAMEHFHSGRGAEAERCYREALSLEGDTCDIRGNLIPAIAQQGRAAEVDQLVEELYRDFPGYFFAQVQWASYLIRQGKLEKAQTLTDEIVAGRCRWHVTESGAYAQLKCQLSEARGDDSATMPLAEWVEACRAFEDVMRSFDRGCEE